jgi:2-polyprenyl-3-methyl-5-hydroxy-6-metoxy-1,4-benzoquinol methylase
LNKYVSRFFVNEDQKINNFIFNNIVVSEHWISRPYEYAWCSQFAEKNDTVLDAASGICHPFKFYLAMNCREIYACDIDDRIVSIDLIKKEITQVFGEESLKKLPEKYLVKIHYRKCSLTELPYEDNMFDKIYCISVLEHLNDTCNKLPIIYNMPILNKVFQKNIFLSLIEFERTLKDNGLVILTFDYPRINFTYLLKILPDIGLKFADEVHFDIPQNALTYRKLYFFRAVLIKR